VRIMSSIARPLSAVGASISAGAAMVFNRARGWGVYLARTRIDYRAEIGDPATNSIVGAVVGWIARNLPEAPIRIVREGTTEIAFTAAATGPGAMLRLLAQPNPHFSGDDVLMATLVDYKCHGNAYWIKQRASSGRVIGLWWIPQQLMQPRWPLDDPTVFISHYDYLVDGQVYEVRPEDVVHLRHGIDPNNTRKGVSPLAPLVREIFTDDEAANFTASLLRNLGVPGVVISPANTTGPSGRQDPETVKTKFMEKFGGDRRGEPLVLTGPTDVKVLSFNPQEMELRQLRRIPEERISANLGVPAGVAQLGAGLDRNTFTNYGEGNVAAYTQGVIPTQRQIAGAIERQLLPDFGGDPAELDVWFDWTKVAAMQALADAIWKRYESAATKGLVKRSTFKRATGQPVEVGDEVYVMPNNYVTVEAGGSQSPGLRLVPGGTDAPPAQLEDASPAALLGPGPVEAAEVRCGKCEKLLAERAVAPYRIACPRCKEIAEAA
jgi:HK97 family phage portal protein